MTRAIRTLSGFLSLLLVLPFIAGCGASRPQAVRRDAPPSSSAAAVPAASKQAPVAAPVAAPAAAPVAPVAIDTLLDDYARFLAGVTPAKYFLRLAATPAWTGHARRTEADWATVRRNKLDRIGAWTGANPVLSRVRGTLFYPFAGADFLFANAYFPDCDTMIMVGLEPTGSLLELHAMRDETCAAFLNKLDASLAYVNHTGYFITKKMRSALWREDLNGTLPLILFYIKRNGYLLTGLERITLDAAGSPVVRTSRMGRKYSAVRIGFTDSSRTRRRAVYYFSFNLANGAVKDHPEFYRFVASFGPVTTLLKAASYLMHDKRNFSAIRTFILGRSSVLLQDDSGIPYREFAANDWTLELHGAYSRTLRIFRRNFQRDLSDAYALARPRRPLPFRIGYNTSLGETNLQIATRRSSLP